MFDFDYKEEEEGLCWETAIILLTKFHLIQTILIYLILK